MKILNLYSGLGGNRKGFTGNIKVTAVEYSEHIASFYRERFALDKVIVSDAHSFLEDNFKSYDFIWSSPPCQSHSSMRQNIAVRFRGTKPVYPDMRLYQEILFLKHNFRGVWIVENVNPYYEPLVPPTFKIGRHLFWSNINIPVPMKDFNLKLRSAQIKDLEKAHHVSLDNYKLKNKRQLLRNMVHFKISTHIFKHVKKALNER